MLSFKVLHKNSNLATTKSGFGYQFELAKLRLVFAKSLIIDIGQTFDRAITLKI